VEVEKKLVVHIQHDQPPRQMLESTGKMNWEELGSDQCDLLKGHLELELVELELKLEPRMLMNDFAS
jgi:hypothetical protein